MTIPTVNPFAHCTTLFLPGAHAGLLGLPLHQAINAVGVKPRRAAFRAIEKSLHSLGYIEAHERIHYLCDAVSNLGERGILLTFAVPDRNVRTEEVQGA